MDRLLETACGARGGVLSVTAFELDLYEAMRSGQGKEDSDGRGGDLFCDCAASETAALRCGSPTISICMREKIEYAQPHSCGTLKTPVREPSLLRCVAAAAAWVVVQSTRRRIGENSLFITAGGSKV